MIRPSEAMELLHVSKTTMYNDLLLRDDFPSYKLGGRYYISLELLKDWIKNQALKNN
ncbi:MAG: helix-turn-helix domain-containing protein [Clostridium sp.]